LQVLTFNFTYRHTSIRGFISEEVIDLLSIHIVLFPFSERVGQVTRVPGNTQFSLPALSDIEALGILRQTRNSADNNLFGGLRVN